MIRFLQSGNKAAKYLLGGLLTIICLSMVIYLIPGLMSDTGMSSTGTIAKVGSQEITSQDVQRLLDAFQRRQPQRIPDFLMSMYRQQAVSALVQQAEVRYEAERLGLKVSDEEIRDEIRHGAASQYLFPNGQWVGQQKYEEFLQNNGLTPETFEDELKYELLYNKLMGAVAGGIDVPPSEVEAAYKEQNTKVKFDYAIINADEIQKQIKPTDAELKAYYDNNKGRYENSIPEKRQVRYFIINDQAVQNKVTVTQTDLDKYYRDHQDEFKVPDRVKARHILINTPPPGPDGKVDQKAVDEARKKAEDILKQVKSGGDFAALAKKYSDDPGSKDKGGELGWLDKGQTKPEFDKTAFSQNKGQISDLVQTSYGFHIIQTEDKDVAHKQSLAEVKDRIEPIVKQLKVSDALQKTASAAETDASTQSLDKAAAKYNSQVLETSNPVARTDALPGIGQSPELMNAIFTVNAKAPPESARVPQGYAIFQVEKIIPPSTPPFEQIKDRVAADFKAARANVLIAQKAQELADRAHAEHDLKKAAKEAGATVKTSDLVGHNSQVPDIGSMGGAANAAFGLKKGEISGPLDLGRNWAVLEIVDRQEPSLGDEFAKNKDTVRQQLIAEKRQQAKALFLENLTARLQKEGKIKILDNQLNGPGRKRG
jgi:peptidyl-prolyl cis-trans isomerase D